MTRGFDDLTLSQKQDLKKNKINSVFVLSSEIEKAEVERERDFWKTSKSEAIGKTKLHSIHDLERTQRRTVTQVRKLIFEKHWVHLFI